MGNRQANKTRDMIDAGRTQSQNSYNSLIPTANADLSRSRDQSQQLRRGILDRYQSEASGPGFGFDRSGNYTGPSVSGANRGDFAGALASYNNFMNTGGMTEQDIGNLRARATSVIPAFYDRMKANMERRRNIQGGYSPGFDAQMAELARESGREAYGASRQAEGDIVDRIMQGKQWGTEGAANIASIFGQMDQNASQANAGLQAQLGSDATRNRLAAIGGMGDLYRSAPGDVQADRQNIMNILGGRDAANQGYIGQRDQNNPRVDWWDRGMRGLGAVGGLMTGAGVFGQGATPFHTNPYGVGYYSGLPGQRRP